MSVPWSAVTSWLARREKPLLVTHRRPDGDALGAAAGLALALRQMGQKPAIALFEAFPARYRFLGIEQDCRAWDARADFVRNADALVILDTCSFSQLEPLADFVRQAPPTLVIDHHATRDDIGGRAGDLCLIDPVASAASLLVTEWLMAENRPISTTQATALLTGLATDCGWFRFSNTDARTLRAAAALVEAGANASEIYAAVYQQEPVQKLRLIGRMLAGLELLDNGRLCVLRLHQADFAAAGATQNMTEDVINEAVRLEGVEVTVLFSEQPDGVVRVNLRSRRRTDVAEVAREFGGGGHARAAGARVTGKTAEVEARVIATVLAAMQRHE